MTKQPKYDFSNFDLSVGGTRGTRGMRGTRGTRFPLFEKSLAKAFLKKRLKTHFAFCTRMNGVKVSRLRRASFLCHKRQKLLFLYTLSTNQRNDRAGFF
jgi:hypothetical protein